MTENGDFSKTMRIDLIPDVPRAPAKEGGRRVVITKARDAAPGRGERNLHAGDAMSQFEALFQSVYDAAVLTDLDGTIVDVNVRAEEFLGYTRSGLRGMAVFDVISGAEPSLIGTLLENLQNERFTVIQAYCQRRDGSMFPSEIAVNMVRLGRDHLSFFIRDVTVRKQAEEMLITEHNALQNAGNGIAVANMDMRIEYANPVVAAMWEVPSQSELVGKNVDELLGGDDVVAQMKTAVFEEGKTWVQQIAAVGRRGRAFSVQVAAACNRNSEGEPVGVVLSFVDISDRKRAEEAEREAERRRVMLASLGAACHHLGQPATVLLANLGVLKSRLTDCDATMRELIQDSLEAVDRLGKILHRLNAVNEYKTMQYLQGIEDQDSEGNRILDI